MSKEVISFNQAFDYWMYYQDLNIAEVEFVWIAYRTKKNVEFHDHRLVALNFKAPFSDWSSIYDRVQLLEKDNALKFRDTSFLWVLPALYKDDAIIWELSHGNIYNE